MDANDVLEKKREQMRKKREAEAEKRRKRNEQKRVHRMILKSSEVSFTTNNDSLDCNATSCSSNQDSNSTLETELEQAYSDIDQRSNSKKSVAAKARNLEYVRNWREKLKKNPELWKQQKEKERGRREKLKAEGRVKTIKEMPLQQREKIRQYNREKKREERMRKACEDAQGNKDVRMVDKKSRRTEMRLRKKVKILENKLKQSQRLAEKWQKRYKRLEVRTKATTQEDELKRNVEKTMKQGKKAIEEGLLFKEAIIAQLKEKKSEMTTEKSKSLFSQCLSGRVMKKYNFNKKFAPVVSTHLQRKNSLKADLSFCRSKKEKERLHSAMKQSIQTFLEKDEHSAIAPGSKDQIYKNGKTMRKRYFSDSLPNLYLKYRAESQIKVSRSTFYRLKPFWIVNRPLSSRDTCLCKTHANFDLLVQKLLSFKIISCNRNEYISSIVCSPPKQECFYRTCSECQNIDEHLNAAEPSKTSFYYQWQTVTENRVGSKDQIFNVKVTKKNRIQSTVLDMIQELKRQLPVYMKHVYDTKHQYKALENIRTNLNSNEAMIVVDFSENYHCKYANEIQSMHFGASKKQVSLHTGVFFYKSPEGNLQCVSFSTVSENLRHDAFAIWAHLDPILSLMQSVIRDLDTIHFQSDGPSTQYKNRTNFYLFQIKCQHLGLKTASWNFTTAGHGKSFADGIGGSLKAMCDRAVCHGEDITSAKDIVELVSRQENGKIKVFEIHESQIKDVEKTVPKNILAIPKIMSLNQLAWKEDQPELLYLNLLSCTVCISSPPCEHFSSSPNKFKFHQSTETVHSTRGRGEGRGRNAGKDFSIEKGKKMNKNKISEKGMNTAASSYASKSKVAGKNRGRGKRRYKGEAQEKNTVKE